MGEWKEMQISAICEVIIDCVNKTAKTVDYATPFKMIRTTNVKSGKIDIVDARFVTEETFKIWTRRGAPQKYDIVLTREAPVGEVGIINTDEHLFLGQRTMMYRANPKIANQNFLYYSFLSPFLQDQFQALGMGSVVEHIRVPDAMSFVVLLPPLPEQRAIAEVLSSLDDKIDLLHRQNKTLESLAETLFRQWFVEEAEAGWESTILARHIEAFRGLSYKGNGLTVEGDGLPMHNLNSVYEGGGYKYEGIKYYNGEYRDRHVVYPGDIIVTNTEQGHDLKLIGFPAIVPSSFGDMGLFSQHIYKLGILASSYLTVPFIYYLLMVPKVREQVSSATNGSTVNMLAIDGLQLPEFPLPPKAKVLEFTGIAKDYWTKKEVNHAQIRTLSKLRDDLLPKLMRGEVRVGGIETNHHIRESR